MTARKLAVVLNPAEMELLERLQREDAAGRELFIASVNRQYAVGLWWKKCLRFEEGAAYPEGTVYLTDLGRNLTSPHIQSNTSDLEPKQTTPQFPEPTSGPPPRRNW